MDMMLAVVLFVLIAGVAIAIYVVYSIYGREASVCPPWARRLLASLRAAVVLLLAAIFLGPSLVYLQTRTLQPTIVLARDASLSMLTADQYSDQAAASGTSAALRKSVGELQAIRPTRVQIVNELLGRDHGKLLADVVAAIGSIDIVLGEIDR